MPVQRRSSFVALAVALALACAMPAAAQGVFVPPNLGPNATPPRTERLSGIHASVAQELRQHGYGDVDVRSLSPGQLGTIATLANSDRPQGEIGNRIGNVLRRGLLQRFVDRATR